MMTGRLDVHSVSGLIAVSSHSVSLDISQPRPSFTIERQKGTLDIETAPARLTVDSSACQSEEGHKTITELSAEFAQAGLQSLKNAASDFAETGHEIVQNFHNQRNIIAKLANAKAVPKPAQTTVTFVPSQPPAISFSGSAIQINAVPDKIQLDWNVSTRADIEEQGTPGIGRLIQAYTSQLQTDQLFAAVIVCVLLGLATFWSFGVLAWVLVGTWHESGRPKD